MTLRANERLRLTKQFLAVHRQGRWAHGETLSMGMLPNNLPVTRLGLRTQRGTKGAVVRNRAKRAFRTVYRRQKHGLRPGYDLLVVLRRACLRPPHSFGAGRDRQAQEASQRDYEKAFLLAAQKLGILAQHPTT